MFTFPARHGQHCRSGLGLGLLCLLACLPARAQPDADATVSSASDTIPQTALPAKQLALPTPGLFQVGGHYDGESVSNLDGGLHRGTVYDGVIHVGFSANSELLGLGSGGQLHISAVQIQSGLPSQRLIGDLQGTSNLAAGSAARVYQFWYRQRYAWHDLSLRAGLIDMNQYFIATDDATLLVNASFGITPTVSANIPSSIYPKPGLGAMASGHWNGWNAQVGIFQGDPNARSKIWHQGQTIIGELGHRYLKFGMWHYTPARDPGSARPDRDWGAYGIAQPRLWRNGARALDYFLQIGTSPQQSNPVPYYLGTGLLLKGLLSGRPGDRIAAGVASAWVRNANTASEVSYEVFYLLRLDTRIYLQPDLQYITNPGGTGSLPNALVGILRLHFEFY